MEAGDGGPRCGAAARARAVNVIGDEAGAAIAEALKVNRTVHTLDISGAWGCATAACSGRGLQGRRGGRGRGDCVTGAPGGHRGQRQAQGAFGVDTAARKGACGACLAMARGACARGGVLALGAEPKGG